MKKMLLAMLLMGMMVPTVGAGADAQIPADAMDMGYQFLKPIYETQGQFVFSPMSLKIALSMAAEGANGATKDEVLKVLGVEAEIPKVEFGKYEWLKVANAAVVTNKYEMLEAYKGTLTEKYEAEVFPMADDLMAQVNEWVKQNTNEMIPEFLSEQPSGETALVLLNALAMDAEWETKFDPGMTEEKAFHAPDADVQAMFMRATRGMEYAETDKAQAVRLPYADGTMEMVVVLPKEGEGMMSDVLGLMEENGLGWLGEFVRRGEVRFAMPKVSLESKMGLKPLLMELGMKEAFGQDADFSSMFGEAEVYVNDVMQKVRMDVDEEGTKAAATTGIMMNTKALVLDSVTMTVDRPYVVLVRGTENGELLFAGVIDKPVA